MSIHVFIFYSYIFSFIYKAYIQINVQPFNLHHSMVGKPLGILWWFFFYTNTPPVEPGETTFTGDTISIYTDLTDF